MQEIQATQEEDNEKTSRPPVVHTAINNVLGEAGAADVKEDEDAAAMEAENGWNALLKTKFYALEVPLDEKVPYKPVVDVNSPKFQPAPTIFCSATRTLEVQKIGDLFSIPQG